MALPRCRLNMIVRPQTIAEHLFVTQRNQYSGVKRRLSCYTLTLKIINLKCEEKGNDTEEHS